MLMKKDKNVHAINTRNIMNMMKALNTIQGTIRPLLKKNMLIKFVHQKLMWEGNIMATFRVNHTPIYMF